MTSNLRYGAFLGRWLAPVMGVIKVRIQPRMRTPVSVC